MNFIIKQTITTDKDIINEAIRASEVRLIDANGEQLGIVPIKEALKIAYGQDLDLLVVNPNGRPPVCKILNYGKHKYQMSKKLQESKKKQKQIVVKEIKLRPMTDEHDINFKRRHAIDFLNKGNKVKVSVMFKGREMTHTELGVDVLKRFYNNLEEFCVIEKDISQEGRIFTMILAPKAN